MEKIHRVIITSENKLKIEAVKKVFSDYFSDVNFSVIKVDGKKNQPFGFDETIDCALHRCNQVDDKDAFIVGLESGIIKDHNLALNLCVIKKGDKIGIGSSPGFLIPSKIMDEVKKGKELAEAVYEVLKDEKVFRERNLISYLTKGKISRGDLAEAAVYMALLSFFNPENF